MVLEQKIPKEKIQKNLYKKWSFCVASLGTSCAAFYNAACDDCQRRVLSLQFPRAALPIAAGGNCPFSMLSLATPSASSTLS